MHSGGNVYEEESAGLVWNRKEDSLLLLSSFLSIHSYVIVPLDENRKCLTNSEPGVFIGNTKIVKRLVIIRMRNFMK